LPENSFAMDGAISLGSVPTSSLVPMVIVSGRSVASRRVMLVWMNRLVEVGTAFQCVYDRSDFHEIRPCSGKKTPSVNQGENGAVNFCNLCKADYEE